MTRGRLSDSINEVVTIVADAGGELVGRTRLQKIAYLLHVTGLGAEQFRFRYKHYGPYSEGFASATDASKVFGQLSEELRPSSWGGTFSVFTTEIPAGTSSRSRLQLIEVASNANPIDLELAATAAFLAKEGQADPWSETAARKPGKARQIGSAMELYMKLAAVNTPKELPLIE